MHTLLIHQAFTSPSEPGGTRHYELARYLLDNGQRFTVIASNLSYLTGKRATEESGFITEQDLEGIRVLRAYTFPSLHRSFVWRIVSFLSFMITSVGAALYAKKIDVVMGTSPPIFQALSAWIIALLSRRPFLLEIRDLWPEFAIDMGILTHPLLIRLSRWLEHFLYARATHILVNSPAYRDYLIKRGVPSKKISFIPNGVAPEMFTPDARGEVIRQEENLAGKFVVTYGGALGVANDIPTILQAASHLRDETQIHFLFVGDGKERLNLEAMAKQLDLPNITFMGSRPKSTIPAILAASDACIATLQNIPMFRTTYPNKVFDYMAAGRPTILAIDGVIREVIEQSEGGIFVPPGDALALAEAIRLLSQNPVRAQEMGQKARNYVVKHFNRTTQAKEFAELLQWLAQAT